MDKDSIYLKHILEAIDIIEGYLDGFDKESFLNDKKTSDAVIRELEIIGEASSNLSGFFIKKNEKVSFRDAIDMRNFLIHDYFGVDLDIVWNTCKFDLPELKKGLIKIKK